MDIERSNEPSMSGRGVIVACERVCSGSDLRERAGSNLAPSIWTTTA